MQKDTLNSEKNDKRSVLTIVGDVLDKLKTIVDIEMQLLKTKTKSVIKNFTFTIVFLIISAVLALFSLGYFLSALNNLVAIYLGVVWSAFIVAVTLLFLTLICLILALVMAKKAKTDMPNIKTSINQDIKALIPDTFAKSTESEQNNEK